MEAKRTYSKAFIEDDHSMDNNEIRGHSRLKQEDYEVNTAVSASHERTIQEEYHEHTATLMKESSIEAGSSERRRWLRVLESARDEHETNIQSLEARIRIGERGLGSLAGQLHDIQTAMKVRQSEIERIIREHAKTKQLKETCEAKIDKLRKH